MVSALEFRGVAKRFAGRGGAMTAVTDLSFALARKEFLAVVGPSGCGKSTILNMVAGLDRPSAGEIRIDDVRVVGPSARVGFNAAKRPASAVANDRAQRRVRVGGARRAGGGAPGARARAELERCRIGDVAAYYPYQLSGGMRQRAALARTLAVQPDIILLDEPFSALDAQTKMVLQQSFTHTIADNDVTTVLITHDLSEAVLMADRILVMSERPGRIVDEIRLDLPDRREPAARRASPRVKDYVEYLFQALHLEERLN